MDLTTATAIDFHFVLSSMHGKIVLEPTVLDAEAGILEVVLPDYAIAVPGNMVVSVIIAFANGQGNDVGDFSFDVRQSVDDKDLPILEECWIDSFQKLKARAEQMILEWLNSMESGEVNITLDTDWDKINNRPETFPPNEHIHPEFSELAEQGQRIESLEGRVSKTNFKLGKAFKYIGVDLEQEVPEETLAKAIQIILEIAKSVR
jgi:hypothetical protein